MIVDEVGCQQGQDVSTFYKCYPILKVILMKETGRQRGREKERGRFEMLQDHKIISNLESDLDETKIETDRQTEREREGERVFTNVIES